MIEASGDRRVPYAGLFELRHDILCYVAAPHIRVFDTVVRIRETVEADIYEYLLAPLGHVLTYS